MKKSLIVLTLLFVSFQLSAQLKIGSAVPEIELPNQVDSIIKLSSLQGKVVLIDFWQAGVLPAGRPIHMF